MGTKAPIDLLSSKNQTLGVKRLILGLDAEVLLRNGTKILWPHKEKLPQTREASTWRPPFVLAGHSEFDWHGDGYAFEVCIQPSGCIDQVLMRVAHSMEFINKRYKTSMHMETPTIYDIPSRVAATAPPEVRALGCAPSFNVYDDPGEPTSLSNTERTTGCHLHVSHPSLTNGPAKLAVRWADIIVGNAWNYISDEDPAVAATRRRAYGRAGEHRRNIYPSGSCGFEYRVLPGRVLSHPVYLTLMFNLLRTAVQYAARYGEPDELFVQASRTAINYADKSLSKAVLEKTAYTPDSRKLLDALAKKPLPILSFKDWYNLGVIGYGHRMQFRSIVKP